MYFNDCDEYFYLINLYAGKLNKLFSGDILNEGELLHLKRIWNELKGRISLTNSLLYKIGTLLDYNQKISEGFSKDDLRRWQIEDDNYLVLCTESKKNNDLKRDYMFGYPANMIRPSAMTVYLRFLESSNYLMNSCGDPLEKGNYQMDNKQIELKIVDMFLEKFHLEPKNYWGYVTTGGTEGNVFGLNNGLMKYPDAHLYCFDDAHYSVNKSKFDQTKVEVIQDENVCDMLTQIINNYEKDNIPAVIILTYGTTKNGRIDDILRIKKVLDLRNIPYYLHIDAALYGGIPNNQDESPLLPIAKINPDSISVSFHKYLGINHCSGIVLAKRYSKDNYIDYIGQNDTTIAGSRDFLPYSTYQQIREVLTRSKNNAYFENIKYLQELFDDNGIVYEKGDRNGNIFVIPKPSNELCLKYQLATFEEEGREYAHIIVFPFHKKEIIHELVEDLVKEKINRKTKRMER